VNVVATALASLRSGPAQALVSAVVVVLPLVLSKRV